MCLHMCVRGICVPVPRFVNGRQDSVMDTFCTAPCRELPHLALQRERCKMISVLLKQKRKTQYTNLLRHDMICVPQHQILITDVRQRFKTNVCNVFKLTKVRIAKQQQQYISSKKEISCRKALTVKRATNRTGNSRNQSNVQRKVE